MRDPRVILTESGYEDYKYHIRNLRNSLSYLQNHVDDLHLWEVNGVDVDQTMTNLQQFLESDAALRGDGETDD